MLSVLLVSPGGARLGEIAKKSLDRAKGVAASVKAERLFEQALLPVMPDLLAYFVRRVLPTADSADCLSETMLVLCRKSGAAPPG